MCKEMKQRITLDRHDLERMLAVLDSLEMNDETFELEVDSSSGIGTVGIMHIPKAINSLSGTFSYTIWAEESW